MCCTPFRRDGGFLTMGHGSRRRVRAPSLQGGTSLSKNLISGSVWLSLAHFFKGVSHMGHGSCWLTVAHVFRGVVSHEPQRARGITSGTVWHGLARFFGYATCHMPSGTVWHGLAWFFGRATCHMPSGMVWRDLAWFFECATYDVPSGTVWHGLARFWNAPCHVQTRRTSSEPCLAAPIRSRVRLWASS